MMPEKVVHLEVLAVVVVLALANVASVTPPAEVTPFCSNSSSGVTCVFVNTVQEVVIGGGPVPAEGIASRHPVKIPCSATLYVTNSSINITVGEAPGSSRASESSLNTTTPHVAPSGSSHVPRSFLNTTETYVTTPHVAPAGPSHVTPSFLNTTETYVTTPHVAPPGPSHVIRPLLNTIETEETILRTRLSGPSHTPYKKRSAPSGHLYASQRNLSGMERNKTTPHPAFGDSGSPKLRNISGVLLFSPSPRECVVNVSVEHSTLHEVRGQFDKARFEKSKIIHLGGVYYGEASVKNSEVKNISLSGKTMAIQDTKIELINDLKVERQLNLLHVDVGRVAAGSMLLLPLRQKKPHTLRHVTVGQMGAESLVVVGGTVNMIDVTMDSLVKDSITVRGGGVLTLTRVVLNHCDSFFCLSLENGARLVLKNTTIRNRTITKMNLQATSETTMYPLFAVVSKDDRQPLQVTFPWYWVIIMAVCGVFAGLVIGSACMWRQKTHRVEPTSTLTLADLLFHDRLQEGNIQDHQTDTATSPLRPPTFSRQDSGLTSSSFASYVPSHKHASSHVTPTVTMTSEGN